MEEEKSVNTGAAESIEFCPQGEGSIRKFPNLDETGESLGGENEINPMLNESEFIQSNDPEWMSVTATLQ